MKNGKNNKVVNLHICQLRDHEINFDQFTSSYLDGQRHGQFGSPKEVAKHKVLIRAILAYLPLPKPSEASIFLKGFEEFF